MKANPPTVDAARPSYQRRRHLAERAFLRGFGVTCEKAAVHFAISWIWDAADESKDGTFFPVQALAADLAAEGVRLQELPLDGVRDVVAEYARRQLLMEFDGVVTLSDETLQPGDEVNDAPAESPPSSRPCATGCAGTSYPDWAPRSASPGSHATSRACFRTTWGLSLFLRCGTASATSSRKSCSRACSSRVYPADC